MRLTGQLLNSPMAANWAHIVSNPCSVQAAWARCIERATQGWSVQSPLKCSALSSPAIPISTSDFLGKRARLPLLAMPESR
jgi:hypothetical protein